MKVSELAVEELRGLILDTVREALDKAFDADEASKSARNSNHLSRSGLQRMWND